jgi:hypothetical protein
LYKYTLLYIIIIMYTGRAVVAMPDHIGLTTRFGADNEKKKSVHKKREIFFSQLVVTFMATMKKIIIFVLLTFFFSISLTIRAHSCLDYGILLLLPVCEIVSRDYIHILPYYTAQ